MHLPRKVYIWLVDQNILENKGQIDHQDNVALTKIQTSNFTNGFLMGQLLTKYSTNNHKSIPPSLADIKADHSKSTKLTNWNFIWLALQELNLKFDSRIKELILQGQDSLIGEVIRQLHDHDESKGQPSKLQIKAKLSQKLQQSQQIDIKKIDLGKNPEVSSNSLQFLVLLLKQSLRMSLEQILGLFTNQNKYLALIIIKGINQNFEPIILFYTLLNKHYEKLLTFHKQNLKDGEAFLHALKPGLMSQCERVVELTLTLFGEFENIFDWFVGSQHKCSNTFMLGLKRHSNSLSRSYWQLLLKIIKDRQLQFFTKHYELSFSNDAELLEITKFIIPHLNKSFLRDELTNIGVIDSWIDIAVKVDRNSLEGQLCALGFIGELMLHMPNVIDEHEEGMTILTRDWKQRSLIHFSTLANELIHILQMLGESKSQMARKVFAIVSQIVKMVGSGDKRDYLVEQFLPLISKFPTIPSEYFISNLTATMLSHSELLLICESIETNSHLATQIEIGNYLKKLFIENPLINFYVAPLIAELAEKIMVKTKAHDQNYCFGLIEEVLYGYAVTFVKYRPKFKVNSQLYFGKNGNPEGISGEDQMDLRVSNKYKELYLTLAYKLITLLYSLNDDGINQSLKQKFFKIDSYIKFHNSKVPSKQFRDFLFYKFKIMIQDKSEVKSKATVSQVDPIEKYTKITSEERKFIEEKELAVKEKKYLDYKRKKVSKELEKSNIKAGQVNVAQISDEGVFQSFVQQNNQLPLLSLDQLQDRDANDVDLTLKKYNKVLRHLFHLYTGTKFSIHPPQLIEDIQKRKETLTSVELIQLLKDYRKLYLTSAHEVNTLIRDINIRLLNKRNVSELDFRGFQMFIIQFCHNNMTIPHEITTNTTINKYGHTINAEEIKVSKNLKDQPIGVILREFFKELKGTFVTRKQKIDLFQDFQDVVVPKQQQYEVNRLESKLERNPNYILPAGYKKIVQTKIDFKHQISSQIKGLPQSFQIAFDALNFIFQRSPIGVHIMEDLAEEKNKYKVKCTVMNSPDKIAKQRAMSTMVKRNQSPLIKKNVVFSKEVLGILKKMPPEDKAIGQEVIILIQEMIDQIDIPEVKASEAEKSKEEVIKRRAKSSFKVQKSEPLKIRAFTKRQQQKQEAKKKQKEAQKKRREHIEKFLQQQKLKLLEKKKKEQQQKGKKRQQEEELLAQKKANAQKFKSFHQVKIEKIKKKQEEALQQKRKEKENQEKQKEKEAQIYKHLKSQIEEENKIRNQTHKEIEKSLTQLFNSEAIKSTFNQYQSNLKALFDFLLNQTHHSLTERNHNNQIVYEAWKYFLHSFQLIPLILQAKQGVYIFKFLTRDKEVPKETFVGLNYKDFLEALLRIAVKYKGFFNSIGERIKERQSPESILNSSKVVESQYNEFHAEDLKIDDLIKENNQGKNTLNQYGDISKVTDKTLKGLIHYLKVPKSKAGQVARFKKILEFKSPIILHKSEKLKQKLNEQYFLKESPKKSSKSDLLQLKSQVDSLISNNEIK